ncbi:MULTISPECIES: hypothetical protein [unclassified Rhizobium]|uniref:hypothetical protein n=1 Tax=unclassified Rhizobium TaxID=2613769 RepID=UPI0007F0C41C|nr:MULTISPECIES: hypothetical protein [unclassified Rhizobium]ANM13199.1 hypothetical protein AMK05_PB00061 [Rhizobium sp. N324]ANM19597.1 hypothetical protein AMK06_PB00061 [Rhizobium sp. N541]ANM25982.1 hypothetical protein AMK07_PB00061 [Rhizobium sp. N941]OYD00992.1 hypothetical protein AMK08_PB00062 [Rhizobium sp. N4311]
MNETRNSWDRGLATPHENAKAPRRMMLFVVTIFVLACVATLAFTLITHPGEPDEASPTPATEQAQ